MDTKKEILTQQPNSETPMAIMNLPILQQRFIHLYLTGAHTTSSIAEMLEVHPNTIYNWLKKKEVQEAITEMQEQTHLMVAHQLKSLTNKAVLRLSQLTDSPIDGVALQAVKDILDRSGHKPKQEIKVDKTVTTFEQRLSNLINDTIDVEYEVVEDE